MALSLILPYTSAVYYAGAAIRPVPPARAGGRPLWDELVSTLAIAVTIAAVAVRVQRASEGGANPSPWVHAALLALVAFALPRLFMKRMLARACDGCPDSGRGSMAMLAILGALAIEHVLLQLLKPAQETL
jgi:hypothetical protein